MALEFASRKATFPNYRKFETTFAGRPFVVETGKLCGLADGAADVAGNGGGVTAHAFGVVQTAQHIGRAAGGSNAHHKVICGQTVGFQILNSQLPAVLCALHGFDKGFFAAGD